MTDPSHQPGPHRVVSDDAMRKWRRRRRRLRRRIRRLGDVFLAALVVVVIVMVLHKGSGGHPARTTLTASGPATPHPAVKDVKLTTCTYSDYAARAGVVITNQSTSQRTYYVEVLFNDGGKHFADAVTSYPHLKPKVTVVLSAVGLSTGAAPTNLHCKLGNITTTS